LLCQRPPCISVPGCWIRTLLWIIAPEFWISEKGPSPEKEMGVVLTFRLAALCFERACPTRPKHYLLPLVIGYVHYMKSTMWLCFPSYNADGDVCVSLNQTWCCCIYAILHVYVIVLLMLSARIFQHPYLMSFLRIGVYSLARKAATHYIFLN